MSPSVQIPLGKIRAVLLYAIAALLFGTADGQAQETPAVHYSTLYFGPNANPVPTFTDASIPQHTTLQIAASHFSGFEGDITCNGYIEAEVPLIARRVSVKVWTSFLEHFEVPHRVAVFRSMQPAGKLEGWSPVGDAYVQTRIGILAENKWLPNAILNITLKTASSTPDEFGSRRYFDTPGYYFDMEIGKSLHLPAHIIQELRLALNAGFLCWETIGSRQNDAVMFGGKVIAVSRLARLEASLAGYSGWMANGDEPLVFSSKLIFTPPLMYFVEYQYGMRNYPFHHIRAGVQIALPRLTPHRRDI